MYLPTLTLSVQIVSPLCRSLCQDSISAHLCTGRVTPGKDMLRIMGGSEWFRAVVCMMVFQFPFCCCYKNTLSKSNSGRKGICLTHTFKLQCVMEGSQGRNSDRNSKARTMEECLLPDSGLASILIAHSLGNGAAHGGQGPPTSIKTQDVSPHVSSQAIPIWHSFHFESQVSQAGSN